MNLKQYRRIWDKHFEYDRKIEKKIKKSIKLWNNGNAMSKAYSMLLFNHIRKISSCYIHPNIKCGDNLYISHANGIVIGQTSEIGNNCRIYPGAKLVSKLKGDEELIKNKKRRHPKIGDNCIIGANCTVVGPITIGDNVVIGAGAVITKDVPSNSIVVGFNNVLEKD